MISDEMRELLSTYVDGELRDADAARVEDMSKRDPELRREIQAYRILRRQLKEWDEEEHGVDVPDSLAQRALARVRAFAAAQPPKRGRLMQLFSRPASMAAGLLLAAGIGVVLAAATGGPDRVEFTADNTLSVGQPDELPPLSDTAKRVRTRGLAKLPDYEPLAPVLKEGLRGWLVDGEVWTKDSLQFLIDWTEQRDQLREAKRRKPVYQERKTVAGNLKMLEVVRGYKPAGAPTASMVVFRHQMAVERWDVREVPGEKAVASDMPDDDRVMIYTDELSRGKKRILLAGEILLGEGDGSNRLRFVSGSSWVLDSGTIPVTWGDRTAAPANKKKMTIRPEMLGPEARRRLVTTTGKDEAFYAWLSKTYKRADLLGARRKERDRVVRGLFDRLKADPGATGFAVVADGKVLGVELFATHDLMLAFAQRLLHGYVMEAGSKAISLRAPASGVADLEKSAVTMVDHVVSGALKMQDVKGGTVDEWPQEKNEQLLRRVNLLGSRGRVLGHGLLLRGRPLHLSLFR